MVNKKKVHRGTGDCCNSSITYYHKLSVFFEDDPTITIGALEVDPNGDRYFSVDINDFTKYELFRKIIKLPDDCKNLRLEVNFVGDKNNTDCTSEQFAYLLKDSKYFSRIISNSTPTHEVSMSYIMMKPEVIQFFNEDVFNNPYRVETMTAEDLARDIFYRSKQNITSDIFDSMD